MNTKFIAQWQENLFVYKIIRPFKTRKNISQRFQQVIQISYQAKLYSNKMKQFQGKTFPHYEENFSFSFFKNGWARNWTSSWLTWQNPILDDDSFIIIKSTMTTMTITRTLFFNGSVSEPISDMFLILVQPIDVIQDGGQCLLSCKGSTSKITSSQELLCL